MDRKQMVAQRVREAFGERLDDVLPVVRQDRQGLRGWEEPAHVRAVARRAVREEGGALKSTAEVELGRAAAEPDRGQQREATGLLLEAGAGGLEKLARGAAGELTPEEVLGLECVLLLYGRPAVSVAGNTLASVPPFWNLLEDQREDIKVAQRGVGRVELLGHPELDWAGTGFLVNDNVLMTTRRVAELFLEAKGGAWQFRPGVSAWMNYRAGFGDVSGAGCRVRAVVGVHDTYDLALLEVEPAPVDGSAPAPLALAAEPPPGLEGRPAYLIGYPVRDARRSEPEPVARIFRDVYNVKRVQPGLLRGSLTFHEVRLLRHDCAPLGGNAGAPVLDLETHQVLGLHSTGRYLEGGTAVPLFVLRDDPLLRSAGVTFAEATPQERQAVADQLERLARSRFWGEARSFIGELHRRAFGPSRMEDRG
jgi:hypothetical protein